MMRTQFCGLQWSQSKDKRNTFEGQKKLCDKMLDVVRSWNPMISEYTQNGCLEKACELLAVSWTVVIAGYAQNGCLEKALETF